MKTRARSLVVACLALTTPALFAARVAQADPATPAEPVEEPEKHEEHEHHHHDDDEIEVTIAAEKPAGGASSEISAGRRELELRPRLRPGDIVEAVPGLFAVQHAGGGKANQYFLRGFDADHGTDVAFAVDGIPVNLPSHGHGQGFTDLHFLIPELVTGLDGYKGTYYANLGDFATAGAVNMHLAEKFEESFAQYSIGQYGVMRGLVVESPDLGDDWRAVLAAELYKEDGPFVNPEQLKRFNIYAKVTHDLGERDKLSATWMSYGSSWYGSGQIPARAVCGEGEAQNPGPEAFGEKCIDHFGFIDPTEGGSTQRHIGAISFQHLFEDAQLNAMAYFQRYDFSLYSNFTFFAQDPVHGDEIEQDDGRSVGGLDLAYKEHRHYRGAKFTTTVGAQVRVDGIDNALWHDEARVRLEDKSKAKIAETEMGLYAEEDVRLRPWVRFVLGARGQRVDVNVDDQLAAQKAPGTGAGGVKGAALFLPKARVVITPAKPLDLFAGWGRGFHSNDARGAVLPRNPATLLTPATSWEIGARVTPVDSLTISATGFLIDLDSELVWSGDEGTTEASGQTRRYGLELSGRYHISNWLFADVDATFTRARYRANAGNGQAVALAPTRTLTAGIGARPTFGAFTPFADVRVKSIGDRPAIEDESLTAQGFTVVDANAGLRYKSYEVGLDVQNLFDARYREVNFATTTRLPYEPAPVTGIHYSPGWPRTVMARATLYWK